LDERKEAVKAGRAIPDEANLAIGTGRHIQATVVFIDVCGFSARPSNSAEEQEKILWMMTMFFAEAIRIIEDYGGVVEKNTGDGLLAYFRDEDAIGQSCDTAAAALLTLRRVTNLIINPLLQARAIAAIEYRACTDWGPITVAKIGAAQRFGSLMAIGATANLASKVMKVGGAGETIVGHDVARHLSDTFRNLLHLCPEDSGWNQGGTPYQIYRLKALWSDPA
jgi:class 3 adenylate cyclase